MNTLINGIKLTIRRWKLQPQYFYLSILGLTVSLSVLVLVMTYLQHELNYDQHIPNRDRIFLTSLANEYGKQMVDSRMGSTLQDKISGIDASTNIDFADIGFYRDSKHIFTERTARISPQFFQVFDFPFLHGERSEEIQPLDVFITESCALKFFGRSDVVGEDLSTKDDMGYVDTYTIRGVLQDIPTNSSIHADIFYLSFPLQSDYLYGKPGILLYNWILLDEGMHIEDLHHQLQDFYTSTGIPNDMEIEFTALGKLHFSENAELRQVFRSASPRLAIILCSITLLILLIAGINYINLFTAKSIEHVKEVGIRKVLGTTVHGIVHMILHDSIKPVVIAMLIAFPLGWWTIHTWLEDFSYKTEISWWIFVLAGLIGLITTLVTMSSQAIRANPVDSLRDE